MRRVAVGLALVWGMLASVAWGQAGGGGPSHLEAGPARADLVCEVDGPVTILKLWPGGAAVKRGDVVCELDSADLKNRLVNAEIALKRAEAAKESEYKALQVAELAARAYNEAEYPLEVQRLDARIKLAEGGLLLAQQEWEDSLRPAQPASNPPGKAPAGEASVPSRERLELMSREFELREARGAERVLRMFTRERRVKELQGAIERARAELWAAESAFAAEKSRAEKLRRQIEACVIRAPRDGVFRVGPSLNIQVGGTVRARQLLGWIVVPQGESPAPAPAP